MNLKGGPSMPGSLEHLASVWNICAGFIASKYKGDLVS
jgi:hypothetical protein